MAFYVKKKLANAEKYYFRAKVVGNDTIKEIAAKLSEISTVDKRDCYAVLMGLGEAMSAALTAGKSVKIQGLGTFYLSLSGNSKTTREALDFSTDVKAVRVRFIPEVEQTNSGATTRAMVDSAKLDWYEWGADGTAAGGSSTGGSSSAAAVTALSLGGTSLLSTTEEKSLAAGEVAVRITGTDLGSVSAIKVAINGTDYDVSVTVQDSTDIQGKITLASAVTASSAAVKLDGTSKFTWTAATQDPMG